MRKLFLYFKTFWKEEIKIPYLILVILFLAASVFVEYHYHITSKLNPYKETAIYYLAYIILYSLPLLFAILAYIFFYNRKDILTNYKFWLTILYIILVFSLRPYFYLHRYWVMDLNNHIPDPFLIKCANQLTKAVIVFVSVFIFWKVSGHSKQVPFYGFKIKNVDLKPYFIMLFIMMPLIAAAATQHDFLHKYPTFKAFAHTSNNKDFFWLRLIGYEILYGSDYFAIELFFRGFVLYSLSRFLGKGAIIPMATMYVFIHFGKPVGETISSFFGGTILGIIAYETNSIFGGIIVHCGIAYMMEFGGFLGNSLNF
jgi:hypothetical protein